MGESPSPAMFAGPRKERVAVFVDYENVHRTGHGCFAALGEPRYETVVSPVEVAELLVAKRSRPSTLAAVHVYRGRPVPAHQPRPASAFDLQAAAWKNDHRMKLVTRDLRYRFDQEDPELFTAQEKGIDVALAVDLAEAAIRKSYDSIIVFSSDTDLTPALELVLRVDGPHLELACWSGAKPLRVPLPGPGTRRVYCHYLNEQAFLGCRDLSASGA